MFFRSSIFLALFVSLPFLLALKKRDPSQFSDQYLGTSYALYHQLWDPSQSFEQLEQLWELDLNTRSITFPQLRSDLLSGKIKSVEGLLEFLPEEYRTSYLLMYRSRSGSKTSYRFPRIISYGHDARLIFAINGNPKDPRYNNVELIEHSPGQLPVFYDIEFRKRQAPVLSHPNPVECRSCHIGGIDHRNLANQLNLGMRWNWNGYFVWEGSYFSLDDSPFRGRGMSEYTVPENEEREGFDEFLRNSSKTPRYNLLRHLKKRFLPGENNSRARPNLEFSQLLTLRNYERLAVLLHDSPMFRDDHNAIASYLECSSESAVSEHPFTKILAQRYSLGPLGRLSTHFLNEVKTPMIQLERMAPGIGIKGLSPNEIEAHLSTLISENDGTYREMQKNVLDMGGGSSRLPYPGQPLARLLKLVQSSRMRPECREVLMSN